MECSAIAVFDEPRAVGGWVRRAREGDLAAFERLYRRYVGRVYAICLRMTGNVAEAEELTQESFIRAWRKLDRFEGEAGFPAWLSRLTIHVVISDRRSRARRRQREAELDEQAAEAPAVPARSAGTALDLESAIAGLPPSARKVFVLHDVEGYKHREIAGMLDVAEGTSKAQLHRARRLLREALER